MDKGNYYEVIGVSQKATLEEIKAAYKKLALKWHPDKNPNNQDEAKKQFQKILHAYTILSDPEKRANYDKYGTDEPDPFNYDEFMEFYDFDAMMNVMMGDLFTNFFGGMFKGGRMRGMKHKVKIPANFIFKQGKPPQKKQEQQKADGEDDWETEEEVDDNEWQDADDEDGQEQNNSSSDSETDGLLNDENLFLMPLFIEENVKETDTKKFKCKLDNEVLKESKLIDHFERKHKSEFKQWSNKKHQKQK